MAVDIGPKIGIEGEREFRQQIAQTNQALKTLAAEGKAVSSAFNDEADAQKKSAAQMDLLNRQIETQKDKVALLEKGLMESARMYGEADVRTMKWQQGLHEATAALNQMENDLRGMDGTVEDTADAMGDAEEATAGWADVMKGSLLADAIKAGLKELVSLASGAATAFWSASKAGAAYADDLLTMATVTGLSTDELQRYAYAAEFVDVSLDTITGTLTKLTQTMNKAKEGEGDAAEVFAELGIAVTESNGQLRSAKDVLFDALGALQGISNETERDAKAMTILGRSAKELKPLMAAGADELNRLGKEAERSGYVLSGSALKALGAQQDAMERLDKKAEALKNNFASKMAPSMTRAYDTIAKTLDNPRVQRGLEVLAQGLGKLIEGAAELADKVLPKVLELFGMGDVQLRTFTDAELALAAAIDETAAAYAERDQAYKETAAVIIEETKRTEGLWKELQTLADENGNVQDSDRDRANYILNELNEALGTEYEMTGNQIARYKDMQKEIANLIKQRQAEALLEAGNAKYTQDLQERNKALEKAAEAYDALRHAEVDLKATQDAYNIAKQNLLNSTDEFGRAGSSETIAFTEMTKKLEEAKAKVAELRGEYEKASDTADAMFASVQKYERAEQEFLAGNATSAVKILTDQMGATVEYYRRKRELSEQDRQTLQQEVDAQERIIEEYKRKLAAGMAGYTDAGLAELEAYVAEAKRILNGEDVAWQWLEGLKRGLANQARLRDVGSAARMAPNQIVKTTRETLSISSPSKVAAWIGEMWDQGLIKGLKDSEELVAKAASGLADTLTAASTPDSAAAYSYGNDLTASGSGWTASSASYTTNLGGITVRIDGAGEVNEDALAARVAVRLTDELIRAQRGGRL